MKNIRAFLVAIAVLLSPATLTATGEASCETDKPLLEAVTELFDDFPNMKFVDHWTEDDLQEFMYTFVVIFIPQNESLSIQNQIIEAAGKYLSFGPQETVVVINPAVDQVMFISKTEEDQCQFAKFWMPMGAFDFTMGTISQIFMEAAK